MPKCILLEQTYGGSTILHSIKVTTPPDKTNYIAGESFNTTGMVVTATYAVNSIPIATAEVIGYIVSPTRLSDGDTNVTITYSEDSVVCTAQQPITVTHRLTGIEVTTRPAKTTYIYGDILSTSGMVVTATYSDGATKTITGYSCSPTILNTVTSNQAITVSYTENGVTQTTTFNVVVNRKPVAKPTWKSNLTYNGNAQSVNSTSMWNGYNSTYMTIDGTISATNAGTYIAVFTPKSNYCWEDNTITGYDASWTINRKAASKPTLSKTSVTLGTSTKSDTFTVTRDGDGTITATSSDTNVATVSVSGNTVTVSSVNDTNGEATITVKVNQGTNYLAYTANDVICSVTASFVSTILNDNSWETIRAVSDAGTGSSYWSVGDTKTITLNGTAGSLALNNFSIEAFIIGFDHNSSKEGSNRIHFQIGKKDNKLIAFCDSSYNSGVSSTGYFSMNSSNTNTGGWRQCQMRTTVLGNNNTPSSPGINTFLAALPSDLRAVMKSCTKYTDNTGGGAGHVAANVTSTTDWLWLLSEFEYFGSNTCANGTEANSQTQYDYYKAGNTTVHYRYDNTGTVVVTSERSPYCNNSNNFCLVTYRWGSSSTNAYISNGVAPAFCV